ncbi:Para-nitrobenzyl esterase [Grifola frondosa]|uniref:Para-nitrobenzyl esterase n=1 Tax=Grifola frondosa TaxID=5627 RepID=A0A1C7MQ97_GRIFR|nr:Para-nitrobenzyl esterase [Grifola frondosa]
MDHLNFTSTGTLVDPVLTHLMNKMLPLNILLLGLLLRFSVASGDSSASGTSLTVHLTSGIFRGSAVSNGTDRWLGIPFAQPPVGSLRFKAPVAVTNPPHTVQDAFAFGNACPQSPSSTLGAPMGEDCLFLNVWRPSNVSVNTKLPVLVWFYGGAYMNGRFESFFRSNSYSAT